VSKELTITCDKCGAAEHVAVSVNLPDARTSVPFGWSHEGSKDFCRDCVKKRGTILVE
jgi:hypothetical protein